MTNRCTCVHLCLAITATGPVQANKQQQQQQQEGIIEAEARHQRAVPDAALAARRLPASHRTVPSLGALLRVRHLIVSIFICHSNLALLPPISLHFASSCATLLIIFRVCLLFDGGDGVVTAPASLPVIVLVASAQARNS